MITAPKVEFQEDKKQKQLSDFGSAIMPEAEEQASSKEALNNFNSFMTSRHRDDDDF